MKTTAAPLDHTINTPQAATSAATTAPISLAPNDAPAEFSSVTVASRISGLSRSTLYELERVGKIRFVRIRTRGNIRGKTLVDLDSLRRFIAQCAETTEPFPSPNPAAANARRESNT